ncbi:hypothetical protein [Actinomadura sp. CNU-125]|uniref:hypothetical protein n=1 Tax=Actinomadura sp. CNU-125 TaxID=1904961 RepID=UPI0021CCEC67|nr:hypothetical protein [Actinomadura sp. CNU-125]
MTITRRVPLVAPLWISAYLALRVYWAATGTPGGLSPVESDLVAFTGWGAAVLCAVAAVAGFILLSTDLDGVPRRLLLGTAWAASLALVASSALLLLDVIGAVFPGLGIEFYPLGALSRAACAGGGVLLGLLTLAYQRRKGRRAPVVYTRTPPWAYVAAYVSVTGCVVRIAAQAVVGFGESPLATGSALLFEAAFLLAGTVLPLSLAHRWGRIWPFWIPALRGRPVPRRLVLWPAVGVAAGITVYFGLMLLQMFWERLHGRNPFPPDGDMALPETFFWVAVPAYWVWGAGLAAAALAYARRTRTAVPETTARVGSTTGTNGSTSAVTS